MDRTLDNDTACLKERLLGFELFDRPLDYDTGSDPVVRVTAGEVRKRLAQYYQDVGPPAVELLVPVGAYVPEFRFDSSRLDVNAQILPRGETPDASAVERASALSTAEAEMRGLPRTTATRSGISFRVGALVSACLLCFGAVLLLVGMSLARNGSKPAVTSLQGFWSPLLSDSRPALIVIGEAPSNVSNELNTIQEHSTTNRLVTAATAYSATNIAAELEEMNKRFLTSVSSRVTYRDLQNDSPIIIATSDDKWMSRFDADLPFSFIHNSPQEVSILDRDHLTSRVWGIDLSRPYEAQTVDYVLVARFKNVSTDNWIVLVGALSDHGIYAGTRFLRSPQMFAAQTSAFARDCPLTKNVEFVLSAPVVNDFSGPPVVVACKAW